MDFGNRQRERKESRNSALHYRQALWDLTSPSASGTAKLPGRAVPSQVAVVVKKPNKKEAQYIMPDLLHHSGKKTIKTPGNGETTDPLEAG